MLASIIALSRPRVPGLGGPGFPACVFLVAAVATAVSVPLGWSYWLEFGSNVSFLVVAISSITYTIIYLAIGALLFMRRRDYSSN